MSDEIQGPQRWINSQTDIRLTEVKKYQEEQIRELRASLDAVWKELRADQRTADGRGASLSHLEEKVRDGRARLDAIEKAIRDDILTKDDFRPYRNGLVSLVVAVGMAVLSGILKLVIGPK